MNFSNLAFQRMIIVYRYFYWKHIKVFNKYGELQKNCANHFTFFAWAVPGAKFVSLTVMMLPL